ncbi:MAG: hypothetical protein LBG27_13610 [Spirochaetaceae bacterium]|jgi:hypothetical protein|nr:hypothetical protein [Spirochaetaceae bacterium]
MRKERQLAENVWYRVETSVNVGEPLFRLPEAKALFLGVLRETKERYGFGMRWLVIENGSVSFYIKPDDGLKLPLIMQWMKQTFSARLNVITGRLGHVWGERYDSEIMWEGPPEWAKEVDWAAAEAFVAATPIEEILTYKLSWGSPRTNGMATENRFLFTISPKPTSPPG